MFKKLALFLIALPLCADSVMTTLDNQFQKNSIASKQRQDFSLNERFGKSLQKLEKDCKLYVVGKKDSTNIYDTYIRTPQEASACYTAALLLAKNFNGLSKNEQLIAQKFHDAALLHAQNAIYDQSTIPHAELYKQFYKDGHISKEEYENDMRELMRNQNK